MSDPRLISPLLDNFAIGGPISEHHGVRCYPAMEEDSDKKYIVKIISIPASQVQLEAFLLTGAYSSEASALSYFKELSEGVVSEAQVLQKLANLEGFVPYDGWQVVPMENAVGYDVYLLSPYRRSLARHFRKNAMTHLGAVNLGLDLCAAMAVCRRAGYLYVDLKPENIFISDDQEYRVGDLGFVSMSSLKYASLPDKYRSAYTAPEVKDAMSSLSQTMDVYAVGLILYQAYNNGELPFNGQAPEEPLPAPLFADYEMAEIILKACAPDPKDRWQDPIEMGQALVSYMQRNGANDTPIVPLPEQEEVPEEEVPAEEPVPEPEPELVEAEEEQLSIFPEQDEPVDDEMADIAVEETEDETATDEADLGFMEDLVHDDTSPVDEDVTDVSYEELTEEVSDILSLADDLIAHETPAPVVAPEPIEVPVPDPLEVELDKIWAPAEDDTSEQPETAEDETGDAVLEQKLVPEDDDDEVVILPERKRSVKSVITKIIVLVLIAALAAGGYYFYQNYYLQSIDYLELNGDGSQLTVSVTSDVDESLLKVVCIDTYGNSVEAPVKNGVAVFNNLNANALYKVQVVIEGFHKLTGATDDNYTTPSEIDIVSFTATTGAEDGSVILRFTPDGRSPESWTIYYSTEGEDEKSVTFENQMVTITGLTVGKTYTFRLDSDSPQYIVGQTEITYTAVNPVYAENLEIISCDENGLAVAWTVSEEAAGTIWRVHCYNEEGFDHYVTTDQTSVLIEGVDTTAGYTVEVIAEGMSSGTRTYMTANAVTVYNLAADVSNRSRITVSWDFTGKAPEGGWLLLYTINGSEHQEVVHTDSNVAQIIPSIPGAYYQFAIQAADGVTVFADTLQVQTLQTEDLDMYDMNPDILYFNMLPTPELEDWAYYDVSNMDYTTTFYAGQKASLLVYCDGIYNVVYDDVTTMFLIQDAQGNMVSANYMIESWIYMWYNGYCELDIPAIPDVPGEYTVTVFFDGYYAGSVDFTVLSAE